MTPVEIFGWPLTLLFSLIYLVIVLVCLATGLTFVCTIVAAVAGRLGKRKDWLAYIR